MLIAPRNLHTKFDLSTTCQSGAWKAWSTVCTRHSRLKSVNSYLWPAGFSHYFKDFAIVYDVTMAAYNSNSSSSNMFAWARSYWRIFKEHQVRSSSLYYHRSALENIECRFWDKPYTLGGTSNKFCDSCAPSS